jgi:hypothetical protein
MRVVVKSCLENYLKIAKNKDSSSRKSLADSVWKSDIHPLPTINEKLQLTSERTPSKCVMMPLVECTVNKNITKREEKRREQ